MSKKKHLVVWAVEVEGSSPHEAACYAMEIQLFAGNTATAFLVDGVPVDVEGDEPSQNGHLYARIAPPREVLVDAFRRWQGDCHKNADGTIRLDVPAPPEDAADILIGYLQNKD